MSTWTIGAATALEGVDFAPSSTAAEILQNVRTILATRKGSVPLDRDFGISWEHLDKPLPVAKMMTMGVVIEALRTYEPRAVIQAVEFPGEAADAMEGVLPCRVTISIDDALEAEASALVPAGSVTASSAASSGSDDSGALAVAQQARQLAARAVNAATQSLAGLHELEVTDYSAIYETGEEN